jgi:integrase
MKHVTLVQEQHRGRPSFALLGPAGRINAFDDFVKGLEKGPYNTLANYSRHIERFADYFIECVSILRPASTEPLTHDEVLDVLEGFHQYLVYGIHAEDEFVRKVAIQNPSPMVSASSSETMHAALRRMLKQSDRVRSLRAELHSAGLIAEPEAERNLLTPTFSAPSRRAREAMLANSMLSAVLAKGPELLADAVLPTGSRGQAQEITDDDAFPFDRGLQLLNEHLTWRDRAFTALQAASGCRSSEAAQVLVSDIDFSRERVKFIAPSRRLNHPSYLFLTPAQRKKNLSWKGRNTTSAMLIEPYASAFWECLERYLSTEYIAHGMHDFLFQSLDGGRDGQPYILSSRSTRHAVFREAVEKVYANTGDRRLIGKHGSFKARHSLRHSYGFYLLNYCPRADGTFGLPLSFVQKMMGHDDPDSTKVYARRDNDLVETDLAHANRMMLFGDRHRMSITEMKREVILSRLKSVEEQMREELLPSDQALTT